MPRYSILVGLLISLSGLAFSQEVETQSQPSISFLNANEAKLAIVDDSLEPYFSKLQPMEMTAKTGSPISGPNLKERRKECRKCFKAGVLEFTKDEKVAIDWCVSKLHPVLSKDFPLLGKMDWSFLKVSDTIEGGLPHTRGKHIVFSETMCLHLVLMKQQPAAKMAFLGALEILVHEQMHVFQRTHPWHCDSLYTKLWGFKKAKKITACKWLTKHHLSNPDAVKCPWVLPIKKGDETEYLWPLVIFKEGDGIKRMPQDFQKIAISLDKKSDEYTVKLRDNNKPLFKDLDSLPELKAIFPLSKNIYHPDEAAADMLGKLVIFDSFIPMEQLPTERRAVLNSYFCEFRKWCNGNLKEN